MGPASPQRRLVGVVGVVEQAQRDAGPAVEREVVIGIEEVARGEVDRVAPIGAAVAALAHERHDDGPHQVAGQHAGAQPLCRVRILADEVHRRPGEVGTRQVVGTGRRIVAHRLHGRRGLVEDIHLGRRGGIDRRVRRIRERLLKLLAQTAHGVLVSLHDLPRMAARIGIPVAVVADPASQVVVHVLEAADAIGQVVSVYHARSVGLELGQAVEVRPHVRAIRLEEDGLLHEGGHLHAAQVVEHAAIGLAVAHVRIRGQAVEPLDLGLACLSLAAHQLAVLAHGSLESRNVDKHVHHSSGGGLPYDWL